MPFFIVRDAGLPEARQLVADSDGFDTHETAEETAGRLYPGQGLLIVEAEDQQQAIRWALDQLGAPAEPPLGEDAVHAEADRRVDDAELTE